MAITESSLAANVADTCGSITTDQRGKARPQSGVCDLGAFEAPDTTRPTVLSVVRVDANPTSASTVNYTVTFSEAVMAADVSHSDFSVEPTGGITGAGVITGQVTGSGAVYNVPVNTGSGDGALRLDVPITATIRDLSLNPLGSLPFTSGDVYTVIKPGTWYISGIGNFFFGDEGDVPVPADYNGDGKAEIAVFRASDSTWYISGIGNFLFGTVGDVPVVADYNGDGKDEIAVFRASNSTWYISGIGNFLFGTVGDVAVPADYNGDGKAEIAVFRASDSTWYISGIGNFLFGDEGDVAVPADYNGDGRAEIAVFRASESTWYISGIGNFLFGDEGDVAVPADYNGDGRADIAVFRP
jgi:putative transposon-encoded protein